MQYRRKAKSGFLPYLFVTPVQLILILVIFIPILYTLWLSFHNYSYGTAITPAGIQNYRELFTDRVFKRALINNIIFVNIVVYLELAIGLGMAVFFVRKIPFKKLIIAIVMAPYAVSTVLGVLMWRFLLEPDIGLINGFLKNLSLPELEWTVNPVHAFAVIIILAVWLRVPFTFLILYNSILGIPTELFDAAKVDGCSGWKVFTNITVPVIMPAILISLMFRYIFAFREFDVVWILTGGGPFRSTELLSVYLYKRGFTYYEFGIASAVAWVMVLITILIGAYYFYILYRRMFRDDT
jgi:multiple sugar transport system permease protein